MRSHVALSMIKVAAAEADVPPLPSSATSSKLQQFLFKGSCSSLHMAGSCCNWTNFLVVFNFLVILLRSNCQVIVALWRYRTYAILRFYNYFCYYYHYHISYDYYNTYHYYYHHHYYRYCHKNRVCCSASLLQVFKCGRLCRFTKIIYYNFNNYCFIQHNILKGEKDNIVADLLLCPLYYHNILSTKLITILNILCWQWNGC